MVAEHRILAVIRHRHLTQERLRIGIRDDNFHQNEWIYRILAGFEIAFISEQRLRTVDDFRAFNLQNFFAIAIF